MANLADEVVVIYHGEIMEAGTVSDIFSQPSHAYLKALLAAVPHFDMKPGQRLKALREADVDAGKVLGTRTAGPQARLKAARWSSGADLTKTFSTRKSGWFGSTARTAIRAVDDVSFDIRRGECLGLVGESGCGKTTVSKLIMRAVTPDAGEIVFRRRRRSNRRLKRAQWGTPESAHPDPDGLQDPFGSLNPRMTVQNILREPLEIHGRGNAAFRLKTAGPDAGSRPRPALSQSLSAQLFRRPAPAHRHRASPGTRS